MFMNETEYLTCVKCLQN